ncbi:MAG TPA: type II secretion system protein GspM [Lysobacter sp.]
MTAAGERERWLALGLLAAVLLLAYGVLIHPWWTVPMREVDADIARLRERHARLAAAVAQAPAVQRRLQQAQQALATRPGFLPEPTAELAMAGLVQRLETVVAQASPGNRSCQISNRSPLQGEGREPYARVAVQVRLRCGMPETAALLHALEAGTPRLFVENLNVLAQRFFFAGGAEPGGREGGLDVSFDLVGYLRPAGVPATGAMPASAPVPMPAPMPSVPPPSAPMPADTGPMAPMPATGPGAMPSASPGGPGAP